MNQAEIKKLNIGCGWDKIDGFINIDKSLEVNPDMVVNIEEGFPFQDDQFEYIYSQHCLEHVRPYYWGFILNEIARIAKDGCILELKLPYDHPAARTNCDHYRTFGFTSFDQLILGNERTYYSNLNLKKLSREPFRIEKLFYYMFPFLKEEIYFKFRIVKREIQ